MEDELLKKVNMVDFAKGGGLVPAIVQDYKTKEVLMLAYMSKESLMKTLEGDTSWFYSRSRNELWNKGATSGNFQFIKDIKIDCDNDTLLLLVEQVGAACHTGNKSCFYREL
ncbi:MAG: phosphoribosyl-AMP cyclohydrolase [Clostridiaceae bacterium]|nr:phosphoribosyl-AMP cyclohydrolase [Clostridiaceae bacterium]